MIELLQLEPSAGVDDEAAAGEEGFAGAREVGGGDGDGGAVAAALEKDEG